MLYQPTQIARNCSEKHPDYYDDCLIVDD